MIPDYSQAPRWLTQDGKWTIASNRGKILSKRNVGINLKFPHLFIQYTARQVPFYSLIETLESKQA